MNRYTVKNSPGFFTFLLFTFYFLPLNSFAKEFSVASYNVENLFDLKHDKSDYKEYIPNGSSGWNEAVQKIKLQNISTVINDLNPDIAALQEIESKKALRSLKAYLPNYPYDIFYKNKGSSVGVAFLSKFPIEESKTIEIESKITFNRPILLTTFLIDNHKLTIFNNHWPSKRAAENERVEYAYSLMNHLKKLPKEKDYILLGDFNSNYDEYKTFKHNDKLNNTYGITGINQILNTTYEKKAVTKNILMASSKKLHYNTWLEHPVYQRFSYIYRGVGETPDNFILPYSMFDQKGISYINGSFNVFTPDYLISDKKIHRWKISSKKKHLGRGYSDHLPIYAKFDTKRQKEKIKRVKNSTYLISYLYSIEDLHKPLNITNAVVIYKHKNSAIIKQPKGRAVYLYNCAKELKIGDTYNLTVNRIENFNGLKEIKEISKPMLKGKYKEYKKLFMDGSKEDIFNHSKQNEIVTNLKGVYKKGYLYINNKKRIKLYASNKKILPKNGDSIMISSAHLSNFRGKIQLKIYKKSDYVKGASKN